jgi:hypothetical protein
MIVSELIKLLQNQDQNRRVVISNPNGGYDSIDHVCEEKLALNVNSNWAYKGAHELVTSKCDFTDYVKVDALKIG